MEREREIFLLLVFSGVFLILTFIFFIYLGSVEESNKITSKASSDQAQVQLLIEGSTASCGDGICNGDENCSSCSVDCGVCSIVTPPGGGGGGGGGGGELNIVVDKELFKVVITPEGTFKTSFKITNPTSSPINFNLNSTLNDLIIFSEDKFSIGAGETKEIFITFYTTSDTEPGVYTGNIFISYGKVKKIPVIIEVESKKIIFDVTLDIPSRYRELFAGDDLLLQLTLFNLGEVGRVDVSVDYLIKDFDGEIIFSQEDTVAVETQASLSRIIKLPSKMKAGDYVAIAQIRYGNTVGTSSNVFTIKESNFILLYKSYFITIVLAIIVIGIIIFVLRRESKNLGKSMRSYRRQTGRNIETKSEKTKNIEINKIKQELKIKLDALNRAYKERHISRSSFEKGKERIKNRYKKLR